jgi:hypothetical protein
MVTGVQTCALPIYYPEIPDAVLVTVTEANTKEEMRCLNENL